MIAFQVIGSLVLILGGLVVVLKILKKYVPSMAIARELAITEQLHLGDRCKLIVIKIRGEELLIGVTRERISVLEKLSGTAKLTS